MVTLQQLDDEDLRELSQRTGPLGVLSVYVDADPGHSPNQEGVAIDLKNRFRELQRRVTEDTSSGSSREVSVALERLWPKVEALAAPTAPGRGRIAFAALGNDWFVGLDSQMPVSNRVVLDETPFIHPLLELLDEGRPAGVVLVSAEEARVLEWRLGVLRELSSMEDEYIEAPHERAGQIGGGPTGRFDTPMREHRQARERDRAQRFLDEVARAVTELASERHWERVLISGDERWTESAPARFPESLRPKLVVEPRVLLGLEQSVLTAMVTERLHDEHTEREKLLVERVREAGMSGSGALGLSEVTAALSSGRAAHLVYDPEVRYTGSVGADGATYGGNETGPDGQDLRPEPRLTERLVEQAFRTGARISPVEGASEGALRDAEGIGALLRW